MRGGGAKAYPEGYVERRRRSSWRAGRADDLDGSVDDALWVGERSMGVEG